MLSAGQLEFNVLGVPMQKCVTQVSSNLTEWVSVKTNLFPASGVLGFSDPTTGEARRFYRAVTEP
jgi:hypothetical protein